MHHQEITSTTSGNVINKYHTIDSKSSSAIEEARKKTFKSKTLNLLKKYGVSLNFVLITSFIVLSIVFSSPVFASLLVASLFALCLLIKLQNTPNTEEKIHTKKTQHHNDLNLQTDNQDIFKQRNFVKTKTIVQQDNPAQHESLLAFMKQGEKDNTLSNAQTDNQDIFKQRNFVKTNKRTRYISKLKAIIYRFGGARNAPADNGFEDPNSFRGGKTDGGLKLVYKTKE